jgi:hypothetical protein
MSRLNKLTDEEKEKLKECERRAREWIDSPNFQKELEESLSKARETSERIREASKIDWRSLQEPFTI